MKLLVRKLSRAITDSELRALFEAHGAVQSCTVVKDPNTHSSKGFAFVVMPKAGEAKVAMKALNGLELDGFKIRVKKAESPTDGEEASVPPNASPWKKSDD